MSQVAVPDCFELGQERYAAGDYHGARSQLAVCLRSGHRVAEVCEKLGLMYMDEGGFSKAVRSFERAIEEGADGPRIRCLLGESLFEERRYAEAETVLARLTGDHSDYEQGHVQLARLLIETGRLGEAADSLRRAVGRHPRSGQLHHLLGIALSRLGRLEDAIAPLESAIRIDPDTTPQTHLLLGEVLLELGRVTSAIECFKASARIYPLAQLYYPVARAYQVVEKFRISLQIYDKALGLESQRGRRDEILYNQGEILHQLGEEQQRLGLEHDYFERAVEKFNAALELNPNFHAARHYLALTQMKRGRPAEAVSVLEDLTTRGRSTSPRSWNSTIALHDARFLQLVHLGYALALEGRLAEAQRALEEALDSPEVKRERTYRCRVLRRLALVLIEAGKLEEAATVWRRLLPLDPDGLYGAADALAKIGSGAAAGMQCPR